MMKKTDPESALQGNRRMWDSLVAINRDSALYDLEGFRQGQDNLDPLCLELMGPVDGLELLHLQCHFGMDTLAWARRGAKVCGVDFSGEAIQLARQLSRETQLEAEFLQADVLRLGQSHAKEYDRVFTSEGVLCWLPDLKAWAETVATHLKPGGRFLLFEYHPFFGVFDDEAKELPLPPRYPYFPHRDPLVFEDTGSYADPGNPIRTVSHEWSWNLGEVISALCAAGLRIDFLREVDFSTYRMHALMVKAEHRRWRMKGLEAQFPLMYALGATRE